MMTEEQFSAIVGELEHFIAQQAVHDPAHDLCHVKRVVNTAAMLCQAEGADPVITLSAAWLHDCVTTPKDHPERHLSSAKAADKAIDFLSTFRYAPSQLDAIHHAICAHSFSAGITPATREAEIVQDADRLDALGAIGVARCIQVGTALGRPLYHPSDPLSEERDADDQRFTIDHFYTKLLSLPSTMLTASARLEGEKRCQFMRTFLDQLKGEVTEA